MKWYVIGICEQKKLLMYMKWYDCKLVYGWYTKVIKKFKIKLTVYTKILVYERYTRTGIQTGICGNLV